MKQLIPHSLVQELALASSVTVPLMFGSVLFCYPGIDFKHRPQEKSETH